jgi:hypothetical protein
MITIATLTDALKIFYLPAIVEQLNYKINPFYANIEANAEEVEGSDIKMAMKYGRSGGVGNRAEDGDLPTPGHRKITQVSYDTKNVFGRLMITDKMMKIGKTSKSAFVNVLENALSDTMQDCKDMAGRELFMDGKGILATCTAVGPVNVIPLAADPGVQYLAEGMIIDICDNVGTVKVAAREITIVDKKTNSITLAGTAVTVLATDVIVISGNYGIEFTGLDAVFKDTGLLYGKDRATYKFLIPNITAVDGSMDELQLQTGIDDAETRAGSTIDFIIASYGVARAYQYLMGTLRSNIETMELKGGYKTMTYNGIPFTRDKYCQKGRLYELAKGDWKIQQLGDWSWMDEDGAILHRVSGKAAYEATLIKYMDLGNRRPAGQTLLTGITELSEVPAA